MRRKKFSIRSGKSSSGLISASADDVLTTALPDGSILLIDGDTRGTAVICVEGTACLTQPCDREDHILNPGETFIVGKKGLVAVTAFTDSRINISAGIPDLNAGTGQVSLADANKYDGAFIDTPF